jgi:succinoglycan biosynthesis protein ExoA
MSPSPFISVIVPVRNEEGFVEETLRPLFSQDYDPSRFEVIVVDGDSTDATRDIVTRLQQRHPQLKLLTNPRRLSSAARNIGVRDSRGEFVVVIDGHSDIDNPHYLREVADAFARSGADCLGRPQPLDATGATGLQHAIAAGRASRLGHHPASFIYSDHEQLVPPQSVAVAYRRSVFDRVGHFDESFDACEDVEFNHRVDRAGLTCFFTPRIRVRYHPRASLRGLFRQLVRYGRGRARLLCKHPETLSIGSLVPAVFVAGLVAGGIASCFSKRIAAVFGTVLALYVIIVLTVSALVAYRYRRLGFLGWLPLIYPTIHVASGSGTLIELMSVILPKKTGAKSADIARRISTMTAP